MKARQIFEEINGAILQRPAKTARPARPARALGIERDSMRRVLGGPTEAPPAPTPTKPGTAPVPDAPPAPDRPARPPQPRHPNPFIRPHIDPNIDPAPAKARRRQSVMARHESKAKRILRSL